MSADHALLQPTTRPVETILERVSLSQWSTYLTKRQATPKRELPTPPKGPLTYLGSQLSAAPFRIYMDVPGRGMLYINDFPTTPSAEVREALMGFRVGDTAALGLSDVQRVQLLCHCTDLNTLSWNISTTRGHTLSVEQNPEGPIAPTQYWKTSLLYLPHLGDTPMLPPRGTHTYMHPPHLAPTPLQWIPKYQPKQ